jgi:hypothetical protein
VTRAFFIAIVIGLAASAAAQQRWSAYANPRFGSTIDYPADLFASREPPPENGDGQAFASRDGRMRLSVWGSYNAGGDTPASYVESSFEAKEITYRHVTARFFVVSGLRNGEIFYRRCNFPAARDDVIDCVHVTYPSGDKAAMDAVVARIARSLRNGGR